MQHSRHGAAIDVHFINPLVFGSRISEAGSGNGFWRGSFSSFSPALLRQTAKLAQHAIPTKLVFAVLGSLQSGARLSKQKVGSILV
jgi:hypothetical protein